MHLLRYVLSMARLLRSPIIDCVIRALFGQAIHLLNCTNHPSLAHLNETHARQFGPGT